MFEQVEGTPSARDDAAETVFTPERPKSDEDEPTADVTREPDGPELKKILLMVERLATRPGGAVGAARRLAATPGVARVDIDSDTTLAEVHYDPARCHARDLVDDLEDDEILGFTEAG